MLNIGINLKLGSGRVVSGGVQPIDPMTLGARLFEYWDASTPATLTLAGALVTSWASRKSGLALAQGTSGFRPVYSATGLGGTTPAVTFDGTDDYLSIDALGSLPVGATPCEIIALTSQNDPIPAVTASRIIAFGGGGAGTIRTLFKSPSTTNNGPAMTSTTGAVALLATNIAAPMTGRSIVRGRASATGVSVSGLNTVALGAETPGVSLVPSTRTRIGASTGSTPDRYWFGPVQAIIVCDILTDAEAAGIFAYLQAR